MNLINSDYHSANKKSEDIQCLFEFINLALHIITDTEVQLIQNTYRVLMSFPPRGLIRLKCFSPAVLNLLILTDLTIVQLSNPPLTYRPITR